MVIQRTGTAQSIGPRRKAPRVRAIVCLAFLLQALLSACAAPSYYVQAASGHLELMRQREDIDTLLANASTEPELARRLGLAREVRAFGVDELGLPAGDSYTQYAATGREAVSWNVVAAPEFSLEPKTWCFLVAGCVPYRGYFERQDAERFADKLRRKGLDIVIAPATAYSTLGWFRDPLLDTMFARGDAVLAGTVFHEMAHRQLYVKGDTAFNESFAMFVEDTGVRLWLSGRREQAQYNAWIDARRASREMDGIVGRHREKLASLYRSGLPETEMRAARKQRFEALCEALATYSQKPGDGGGEAASAGDCSINNASLALRNSYHGGICAFESLYRESGADFERFLEKAESVANWPAAERAGWLKQPCPPVAPNGNL